jgi:thiamine-monophosphate kinase
MSDSESEAALIESLFAPLSLGAKGSFGLRDDVAFLPSPLHGHIVTQDQIIEGTHFLPNDPLDMIAKRLVRRNLSDLIAKGGVPTAAFLSLAWPKSRDRAGLTLFARGLGEDLAQLCGDCPLMGGDTSETSGPLVASLTMLGTGTTPTGQPVLRSGAQSGDVVVVTGVIGDAYLGLQARLDRLPASQVPGCVAFSLAPHPPSVALSPLIGRYANASIDVSDGLILDAQRIAIASSLRVDLTLEAMPLSTEAAAYQGLGSIQERALALATGGDDYQPLLTLTPVNFDAFKEAAATLGISATRIGKCTQGGGLQLTYDGLALEMPLHSGWQI